MNKVWSDKAWNDYLYWQSQDRKTLRRINSLIKNIERTSYSQDDAEALIGKAELLKGSMHGLCSVRIDKTNRLIYKVEDANNLFIVSCKGHYQ